MSPRRARVQLLILFAILLLLAGLVVTGVARLRQEAARMMCVNHAKQLGLGVLAYHDANDRLPPLVDQGNGSPTGRGLPSLFWHLIPFLESTWRLYSLPEGEAAKYHAASSTTFAFRAKMENRSQDGGDANQTYPYFTCPADLTADHVRDVPVNPPDGGTGYYATGSYAANGLAPWNRRDFRWGASGLILLAERPQACRTATWEVVHNLWGVGFYSPQMPAFATLTPADPPGLGSTGQVSPVCPLTDAGGEVWVRIGRWDAEVEPSDFTHPIQRLRGNRPCDPRLPGSHHPEGMTALMADGSVRAFRYDTAAGVFWAACVPD